MRISHPTYHKSHFLISYLPIPLKLSKLYHFMITILYILKNEKQNTRYLASKNIRCTAPYKTFRFSIQLITNHRFLITSYPIICIHTALRIGVLSLHPFLWYLSINAIVRSISSLRCSAFVFPKHPLSIISCTIGCAHFGTSFFSS